VLLFASRIGASLVEVASESYFFKHIHPDNAGYISLFRMTRSLPYVISPVLLTIAVVFFDFKYVFMITGVLMLFGVRYTLRITEDKDPEKPISDTVPLSKQIREHSAPEGYITN
jgi:MFS-type transporter involved in bile tolerance (Atg22 family)